MGGLVNVPLAAAYQAAVPADARGNAMSVRNLADYVFMSAAGGGMFALAHARLLDPQGQLWLCAAVALGGAVLAWRGLFRPAVEQVMEIVLWPLYRIRGHGPGLHGFPTRGPLLVIANHAAWLDPLWVGKVVPRRVIPMMTSAFYDLPGLKWLMKTVVQAVRVEASSYRREAPELKQALAVLDAGGCVLMFPEGQLRKRADTPLRQFGQGVALLLHERPATPVVVCWIEGGWGSYFSYEGGPPTRNKRMDFWRRIDVAVSEPEVLGPALLDDQRATRAYLMQKCLAARRHLGLQEVQAEEVGEEPAEAAQPQ
jgi:1-acyl-sn-glycerol-3-phosphate acyltransferase